MSMLGCLFGCLIGSYGADYLIGKNPQRDLGSEDERGVLKFEKQQRMRLLKDLNDNVTREIAERTPLQV